MDDIRSEFVQQSPDPESKQESDRHPDLGIEDHGEGRDPEDLYIVDRLPRETRSFRGSEHSHGMPIPLQERRYPTDKIIHTIQMRIICIRHKKYFHPLFKDFKM